MEAQPSNTKPEKHASFHRSAWCRCGETAELSVEESHTLGATPNSRTSTTTRSRWLVDRTLTPAMRRPSTKFWRRKQG